MSTMLTKAVRINWNSLVNSDKEFMVGNDVIRIKKEDNDKRKIASLEKRIKELEEKIRKIEQKLYLIK